MKRAVLLSVAWLMIGGTCITGQQPAPGQPRAGGTPSVLEAWLECVECRDGELVAVVKLGASAVASLSPALIDGPPAAKMQAHEKYLRRMHSDMVAYQKSHPTSVVSQTADVYVTRNMAKYVNLYRVRAAIALGEIGGPGAAAALDLASKLSLDPYVLAQIKEARAKIK